MSLKDKTIRIKEDRTRMTLIDFLLFRKRLSLAEKKAKLKNHIIENVPAPTPKRALLLIEGYLAL